MLYIIYVLYNVLIIAFQRVFHSMSLKCDAVYVENWGLCGYSIEGYYVMTGPRPGIHEEGRDSEPAGRRSLGAWREDRVQ